MRDLVQIRESLHSCSSQLRITLGYVDSTANDSDLSYTLLAIKDQLVAIAADLSANIAAKNEVITHGN